MADPYAAWVHLPPADLSDIDPSQERPTPTELDFYFYLTDPPRDLA